MRVALVCPYSVSRPGGVQGQVLGLARTLQRGGHDVSVLAPVDGEVDVPGVAPGTVVALGRSLPVPANGSVAPVALSPLAMHRALAAVRARRPDVVHLHEPLAPVAGYALLVACGQPKIATFHRAGTGAGYRLLAPALRWMARRIDTRCAVSPSAARTAADALGGTYEIVGNGVDVDRFASAVPWPTSGPTILFVGRHERRKGLAVLLEAVARLTSDVGRGATVWVVGSGPDTEVLRARHGADRRVQWLGAVGDEELAARLRGAHVLCAPSLGGESFGMVLLEAMTARAAVVASDIPGYGYVAGGHSLLVAPGDVGALAQALDRVLADAAAGSGMCAPAALDTAAAHAAQWSMDALAARYVAIYRAALSRRRHPRSAVPERRAR